VISVVKVANAAKKYLDAEEAWQKSGSEEDAERLHAAFYGLKESIKGCSTG